MRGRAIKPITEALAEGWFVSNGAAGQCECGCGNPAPIATKTSRKLGHLKGQAQHYLSGHNSLGRQGPFRVDRVQAVAEGWFIPNSNAGFCECGCGQRTLIAKQTSRKDLTVLGEPLRFIHGHAMTLKRLSDAERRRNRRAQEIMRAHSITLDEYGERLRDQLGVCAICAQPELDDRHLAVDHDHLTGLIRGLLCRKCNQGLGLLGDTLNSLKVAVAYLEGTV